MTAPERNHPPTPRRSRRRKLLAAGAAVLAGGSTLLAMSTPTRASATAGAPQTYTGCLTLGILVDVGPGNFPPDPCFKGQTQVSFSAGTLTGIVAGSGLSGGGNGGTISLSVDPSQVQSRVNGSCAPVQGTINLPAVQAVQSINQDGSVTCTPVYTGTVTSVNAGPGLTGGGSGGDVTLGTDFSTVQQRVAGGCAGSGGAISRIHADGTVDCYSGPRVLEGDLFSTPSDDTFPHGDNTQSIASFDVPAGNWVVNAQINTVAKWNGPSDTLDTPVCRLFAGDGQGSESRSYAIPVNTGQSSAATIDMTAVATGPATVDVRCTDLAPQGFEGNTPVTWNDLKIIATEAGDVSDLAVTPAG